MISLVKIIEQENDRIQLIAAIGPKALPVGASGKYEIIDAKYAIQENTNIFIQYATQTGNKFVYKWKYNPDTDVIFVGEDKKGLYQYLRKLKLSLI